MLDRMKSSTARSTSVTRSISEAFSCGSAVLGPAPAAAADGRLDLAACLLARARTNAPARRTRSTAKSWISCRSTPAPASSNAVAYAGAAAVARAEAAIVVVVLLGCFFSFPRCMYVPKINFLFWFYTDTRAARSIFSFFSTLASRPCTQFLLASPKREEEEEGQQTMLRRAWPRRQLSTTGAPRSWIVLGQACPRPASLVATTPKVGGAHRSTSTSASSSSSSLSRPLSPVAHIASANVGKRVSVAGWLVSLRRISKSLVFAVLLLPSGRGRLQLVAREDQRHVAESWERAGLHGVVQVEGILRSRPQEAQRQGKVRVITLFLILCQPSTLTYTTLSSLLHRILPTSWLTSSWKRARRRF